MQIKLKKEQLSFMDKYALCTDSKMAVHEKFQISIKKDKLIFSQKSNVGYLITEIDYKTEEEGNIVFDTVTFVSLIKSIPDNTEITITEKGIEFLKNSYDIVNTDMELGDVDEYLQISKEENEKFTLKDVDNFIKIREYSSGDELNTVSYQNGYFVSSNQLYVTAFSKTKEFKLENDFYFSLDTFALLTNFKIKEIDIFNRDNLYFFKIDNTYIFIIKREYVLPNMFMEEIKPMYEHPYKFTVAKVAIKETLSRMKIVARNNKEGRIYFHINENVLNVKNTDTQFAQEDITIVSDKEINGIVVPLSVNYLSSVIDKCDGKEITCYCTPVEDNFISMKVEDETKNYFYILNLLEK
jgi:DNA polymerase III sliding clamp (beta) subunit (PCNA family)